MPNLIVGLLVAIILVASAVAVVLSNRPAAGGADAGELVALVHDGEGNVHELPLAHDDELVVETALGRNLIAVEKGTVFMRDADCPGQDCMHQGALTAQGRQIICLPHRLWIEVVAAGEDGTALDVSAANSGSGEDLDVLAR